VFIATPLTFCDNDMLFRLTLQAVSAAGAPLTEGGDDFRVVVSYIPATTAEGYGKGNSGGYNADADVAVDEKLVAADAATNTINASASSNKSGSVGVASDNGVVGVRRAVELSVPIVDRGNGRYVASMQRDVM
jgi:hypothetical protein